MVTLSSQPKAYGSSGYTTWQQNGNVILEEAYVLSKGTTDLPSYGTEPLDTLEAILAPKSESYLSDNLYQYTDSLYYYLEDVYQASFLEFEFSDIGASETIFSFNWDFESNGDSYENDFAAIGLSFKKNGNSYFEPTEWIALDFAVGFADWATTEGNIYTENGFYMSAENGYSNYTINAADIEEFGSIKTYGYFEVDYAPLANYETITAAKLIIGAAEISVTGSEYYPNNKFSIYELKLESAEDEGYTVPGGDIQDEDYTTRRR